MSTQAPDAVQQAFGDLKAYLSSLPPSTHVPGVAPVPGTVQVEGTFVIATAEEIAVINTKIAAWDLAIEAQWNAWSAAGYQPWQLRYDTTGSGAILGARSTQAERRMVERRKAVR
jgi:hypothetical protein